MLYSKYSYDEIHIGNERRMNSDGVGKLNVSRVVQVIGNENELCCLMCQLCSYDPCIVSVRKMTRVCMKMECGSLCYFSMNLGNNGNEMFKV